MKQINVFQLSDEELKSMIKEIPLTQTTLEKVVFTLGIKAMDSEKIKVWFEELLFLKKNLGKNF